MASQASCVVVQRSNDFLIERKKYNQRYGSRISSPTSQWGSYVGGCCRRLRA